MKKLIILLILILLIGGYIIKASYDLDFDESSDKKTFIKVFSSWVGKLLGNFKNITTYAIKQDWGTPGQNKTND